MKPHRNAFIEMGSGILVAAQRLCCEQSVLLSSVL